MGQSISGMAFEYAIGKAFNQLGFKFKLNKRLKLLESCYDSSLDVVGEKVADYLSNREKGLEGKVVFMPDSVGKKGNPTDIRVGRLNISAKRRSVEIKAPRISDSRDFARNWFGLQADISSLRSFKDLFKPIRLLRRTKPKTLWRNVNYEDYLEKGINLTICRLEKIDNLAKHWFKFIMGSKRDYYLVSYMESIDELSIVGMNFNGTLSCQRLDRGVVLKDMHVTSWNRFVISFTNDWAFDMRLHSARSRVEPSLKYSVTIKSMPRAFERHKTLH